jgi:hypothetical protein
MLVAYNNQTAFISPNFSINSCQLMMILVDKTISHHLINPTKAGTKFFLFWRGTIKLQQQQQQKPLILRQDKINAKP